MIDLIAGLDLLSPWLLGPVYASALALVALLVRRPGRWGSRWWWTVGAIVLGGAGAGLLVAWWFGDVQDLFGASPTVVDRAWIAAATAALGVALLNLVRTDPPRRVLALLAVVAVLLAASLGVNRDAGAYATLGSVLGMDTIQALVPPAPDPSAGSATFDPDLYRDWTAPADLPDAGRVGSVTIPGTVSGFAARDAIVYLPPAALVADPPALPVVILLSGQPGQPSDIIDSGRAAQAADRLAAQHDGLAPIIVVPDQLGPAAGNPMCVDGPLGNSASYLMEDVVPYIGSHYRVAEGRQGWTIGGFSQGGTCAIQLGAAHPDVFGSLIDISGELGPSIGDRAQTIAQGFRGDEAAYDAAQPQAILAANGPYSDMAAYFAVGANDTRYAPNMAANSAAAEKAGMRVTTETIPGSAHDWTTASKGIADGLTALYPRWGLAPS